MTPNILDLKFSRLVVGTVQFGLPYGVANRSGQPSFDEVCRILEIAVAHGATTLDTAAAYGQSEAVLGRALRQIGALERVIIVSKVRHVGAMEEPRTPENVRRWIRGSVEASLAHLGIESLPVCLFHHPADIPHMDALLALKAEELVQHAGVSVSEPADMGRVLATPGVEAIQLPASMLDQRILRAGDLARAAAAGMAVFVRSIYLQGLLVMPEESIPAALQEVIPARRALQRIADEAGTSLPELALRYGLALPGATGVLTGVETAAQMRENVRVAGRGPLPPDVVRAIDEAVPDLAGSIVLSPWLWPNPSR